MLRLLVVTNLFPPVISGGFEIECEQVVSKLASLGYELHVITSDYKAASIQNENVSYPVTRSLKLFAPMDCPINSAIRFKKWIVGKHNEKKTAHIIKVFRPDIMIFFSPLRLGLGPARAAAKHKIPIVWRVGDLYLANFTNPPKGFSLKQIYRFVMDRLIFRSSSLHGLSFDYVSCISKTTQESLLQAGVPIEKAEIHPRGIPIEMFPPKKQMGSVHDPVQILYVGRVHPEKGLATLIQAVSAAEKEIKKEFTLTIVGTGAEAYLLDLRKQASDLGVKTNFTGFIPYNDLSQIYMAHDIFIFPSIIAEGQGATYLEAMSSGLPVIATTSGGQKEILENEENALLFPAGDASALTKKIVQLVEDSRLRKKIAENGRNLIISKLSFPPYIQSLKELLIKATKR